LAKEFSQDPGSAAQGGDLGWAEKKVFVGPFADAAFSMKVDEIRGPVKTQFGYHILKLDGIQPPAVKTFEQSKAELEIEYKAQRSRALVQQRADSACGCGGSKCDGHRVGREKGRIDGAGHRQFQPQRRRRALGKVPAVIDAAFQPGCAGRALSPIVEVEKGRGVVLRARITRCRQQKPLEAVRTRRRRWKKRPRVELAAAAAADAAKRVECRRVLGCVWRRA